MCDTPIIVEINQWQQINISMDGWEKGVGIVSIVDNYDWTFTRTYGNGATELRTSNLRGAGITEIVDNLDGTFTWYYGNHGDFITTIDLKGKDASVNLWDASAWTLPPVELWVSSLWVVSVAGTLPAPIGAVNPWDNLIRDWMVFSAVKIPVLELKTINGNDLKGTGDISVATLIGYTPYDATNPDSFIALTDLSAGTGIGYDNTTGEISNTAPDQTVSITAGTNISVTGTYPNFTIENTGSLATTEDVTANLTVGSINSGDVIATGTTLTQFVKDLLITTYYPTFNAPSFSLTSNQASGQEIGTVINNTLTYNFNRGSINGKLVWGIWQPATFQNYRAGAATNYVIDGSDEWLGNTKSITGYTLLATQTYSGTVTYSTGSQATDSDGANYSTPLAGGTSTQSTTITALYPWFYGKVAGGSKPTKNQALINSWTKVVAGSSSTLSVTFWSGINDWIWFAIPQASTSKTTWYIDVFNNWSIGWASNLFDSENIVSIDSPTTLRNGVNYKIYVSNYQSQVVSTMQLRN